MPVRNARHRRLRRRRSVWQPGQVSATAVHLGVGPAQTGPGHRDDRAGNGDEPGVRPQPGAGRRSDRQRPAAEAGQLGPGQRGQPAGGQQDHRRVGQVERARPAASSSTLQAAPERAPGRGAQRPPGTRSRARTSRSALIRRPSSSASVIGSQRTQPAARRVRTTAWTTSSRLNSATSTDSPRARRRSTVRGFGDHLRSAAHGPGPGPDGPLEVLPASPQVAVASRPVASSRSSWLAVQRSWVSSSAVIWVVRWLQRRPPGRTPRGPAPPRPAPPSGRPAAISAWIAAAARRLARTALEVCRSRLPNWVWYSVRSHSPIRACRRPDRRSPRANASWARTSRPCSRSSSGWSLADGGQRAGVRPPSARDSRWRSAGPAGPGRAGRARVKVRVSRSAVPDQLVGRRTGGGVGLQLDQLAQGGGPMVVPGPQPVHRRMADALGQREFARPAARPRPGSARPRPGTEPARYAPAAVQASTRDRSASLSRPALSSTLARSMPTTPRSKSECAVVGTRHQLQGPWQVAGEELEEPEVVGGVEGQVGRLVRLGPGRSARAQSALAAPTSPSSPCTSPRLIRILHWSFDRREVQQAHRHG